MPLSRLLVVPGDPVFNKWIYSSSSSFGFSHQGSPQRIFLLQLFLSTVSSSVTSTSAMSSFTTSINLLFGLPRFLFPGNSILSILLPIYPSSFLRRCPYHLSLASRVFSPNFPTCAVPLMYSFLILSILVTPNENCNFFNSATSISASCLFASATVSNPYNIAGLTATLYTFPFTLAGTLLSQITPDTLLHPFHPACTLFFTFSSSPVSRLPVPCSRCRSQCHQQTSWSMELPLWSYPSSYPSHNKWIYYDY